ncbi:hypothetical protein ZWY2020_005972 [Hordeum vulgare]|nr:hypothetical protein ZWY2020_005972 [Hordeum vulgare]
MQLSLPLCGRTGRPSAAADSYVGRALASPLAVLATSCRSCRATPSADEETTMNAQGSPASKRRSSIKPHPLSSPLCTGSSPKPAVATRTSWSSPSPGVPSPSTSSDQQDLSSSSA